MSAIFKTEFPDYLICGEDKIMASTAKLVLLAIADHANDEGESAYPGMKKLGTKTGLSKSGIIKAIKCLKHNGLLLVAEEASKLGTNNYTIVTSCYPNLNPEIDDGTQGLLVHGVIQGGTQGTPPVVDSVDTNHPLIINNHPSEKIELPPGSDIGFFIAAGVPSEEIAKLDQKGAACKVKTDHFEREMGYNPLEWYGKKLERLRRFLDKQTLNDIKRFALWSKRDFSSFTPAKARQYPDQVIDLWPQACPPEDVSQVIPSEPERNYIPAPGFDNYLKGKKK